MNIVGRRIKTKVVIKNDSTSNAGPITDKHRSMIIADIVKENKKSLWARLPNGNIIKRKKRHYMELIPKGDTCGDPKVEEVEDKKDENASPIRHSPASEQVEDTCQDG